MESAFEAAAAAAAVAVPAAGEGSATAAAARVALGLPWQLGFYEPLNGPHPLVASYVRGNPAVSTLTVDPAVKPAVEFCDRLLPALCGQARMLDSDQTRDFLHWTCPAQQAAIEAQAGACQALFHHTTPLHLGSAPWIFHFESFPSLFMPFMMSGWSAGTALKGRGWFERVRTLLASDDCRAIITHMHSSRAILERVMDSAAISAKLHHAPLGIEAPERARALEKFARPGPLRILFTNSLHQHPNSFYLRGGHHLLRAFSQLRQDGVDVELTIISSLPGDLAAYFSDRDLAGVRWIAQRVDDAALEQLLLTHHLFALPAAGLHSYSVLRALSHGCVPIVSDALGYEEYTDPIQDSVFIVRGVREMVYRDEPEGWVSDRYEPFVRPSLSFSSQIYRAVAQCGEPARLRPLAQRNAEHCASRYDRAQAQAEFNRIVSGCL
jgi:hypothetical protein